ncbi:pantoate--beta-alanine ligase [Allosphingosinicella vermicomposti]|uniref:pantoate--beta-alanine ligase n=1 Tax=Allosphingosinicella vermicomposti TaxID=614671 RepID=UPI000D107C67|nr:pantoate--beta-alanine ligase [Allosphingosinicella vermicomposti]
MQIIRDLDSLRAAIAALRADRGKIAFVPTMGALHAGHMALICEASARASHVVASVFVNPTQFGPNEDFGRYPRKEAEDSAMLEAHGASLLWLPPVEVMYPEGHATTISVSGISEGLCGASRPGHFDGVATVVAKLFNQVGPDVALFGEKDYQQLAVIRRMAADLDFAVEVASVPTQRDADGLALSSRNAYLSPEERIAARALPRALGDAAQAIQAGGDIGAALQAAQAALDAAGFASIDYVELRDADTLAPVTSLSRPARILAAARIGTTRLIDNLPVLPAA